jgi:hypothetical protein
MMNSIKFEENPAVYAKKVNLGFKNLISANELKNKLEAFLSDLTAFLQNEGCILIGHIKGMLQIAENSQLFFSITSFGEKIKYRGELTGKMGKTSLTINVIVYGIEQNKIERGIHEGLETHFDPND